MWPVPESGQGQPRPPSPPRWARAPATHLDGPHAQVGRLEARALQLGQEQRGPAVHLQHGRQQQGARRGVGQVGAWRMPGGCWLHAAEWHAAHTGAPPVGCTARRAQRRVAEGALTGRQGGEHSGGPCHPPMRKQAQGRVHTHMRVHTRAHTHTPGRLAQPRPPARPPARPHPPTPRPGPRSPCAAGSRAGRAPPAP